MARRRILFAAAGLLTVFGPTLLLYLFEVYVGNPR